MRVEIVQYENRFENELMEMIGREGEDWKIYWGEPNASKYRRSFSKSITYLALADGKICGYSRSLADALFLYVCDLLVDRAYRGNSIGERLLRRLRDDYPEFSVYIMSGNDRYYEKLACKREGSIYLLE